MFEVLIDTNGYRKDPNQSGLPFKVLMRLCQLKAARVHLPYIVKREFESQQIAIHQKELHASLSAIAALLKKSLSPEAKDKLGKIKEQIESVMPKVLEDAASNISKWSGEAKSVQYPLDLKQAENAMEAYFHGHPPLKEPKVRNDIPDAFLYQSVVAIARATKTLFVISEDAGFGDALAEIKNVTVLKSLSELTESADVQTLLKKHDEAEAVGKIVENLENKGSESIASAIQGLIGEKIMWEKIHSSTIPDDNKEATISGFGEAENIDIDYGIAVYYGDGKIGIPFTCRMWASAFFYVFKSDVYTTEGRKLRNVSDHNEHYFEAEDDFDIQISGSVSITVDVARFHVDADIDDYVDFDSIDIESITSIDLLD